MYLSAAGVDADSEESGGVRLCAGNEYRFASRGRRRRVYYGKWFGSTACRLQLSRASGTQ